MLKHQPKLSRVLDAAAKGENPADYVEGKVEGFAPRRSKVEKRTRLIRYVFNPELAAPVAGEQVAVCHKSDGNGKLTRSSIEQRVVKFVYMSDSEGHRIQDNQGDVWHVRPASVGGSKWETFYPGEKIKVKS